MDEQNQCNIYSKYTKNQGYVVYFLCLTIMRMKLAKIWFLLYDKLFLISSMLNINVPEFEIIYNS